ncbi:FecR family protein [Rhizobium sp. SL42]|uniref:FecR family protein n=1 Tax=Rhizobium sp. SL42 TaxID=2806346 RepID=UPI001F1913E8|nr:FecR family protein [Rhizobium sp. SL42]UJW77079.1 FecR family protein [Rhizobium sp. SL42]
MTSEPRNNRSLLFEEASEWLIRIRENPQSADTRATFEAWRRTSSDHEQAWSDLCRLWSATGKAEPFYRPLAQSSKPKAPKAMRLPVFSLPRLATALAIVCVSALAVFFAAPSLMIRLSADHVTTTAEIQTIRLEDGSTVQLAPESALRIEFHDGVRQVVLVRGEAFFDVAKDTNRKFKVVAGGTEVEVLGTAFDVHVTEASTTVSVARGSVSAFARNASPPSSNNMLAPGDAIEIDERTGIATRTLVAADDVGSWRQGRLVVSNATIASVVDVIRHYDSAWITLADTSLGEQRVTGIYDLKSPELALGALVDPFGGRVRNFGSSVRVISRH